jgi:hypothetical protein
MFKEILWLKKQNIISIAMLIQQIKENVKFSCQQRKVTKALDMDDIICQVLVWPVGFAPTRYIVSLPKGQCRVLFFSHNNFYSVLVRSYHSISLSMNVAHNVRYATRGYVWSVRHSFFYVNRLMAFCFLIQTYYTIRTKKSIDCPHVRLAKP